MSAGGGPPKRTYIRLQSAHRPQPQHGCGCPSGTHGHTNTCGAQAPPPSALPGVSHRPRGAPPCSPNQCWHVSRRASNKRRERTWTEPVGDTHKRDGKQEAGQPPHRQPAQSNLSEPAHEQDAGVRWRELYGCAKAKNICSSESIPRERAVLNQPSSSRSKSGALALSRVYRKRRRWPAKSTLPSSGLSLRLPSRGNSCPENEGHRRQRVHNNRYA